MLFNSREFIFVFLPIVAICFFAIAARTRVGAAGFLGLASLFFYGYWSVAALPLLAGSVCVNYCFGLVLARSPAPRGKSTLYAAIGLNLAVLCFFKYVNFFVELTGAPALVHVMLPIGISFFTFTQIAFLADCHAGKAKEPDFIHYLLFVTYFPHLIAGPLLHHAQVMPQFARRETYLVDCRNISAGLILFSIGLAKKVLVADGMFAGPSNAMFDAVAGGATPGTADAWVGAIAYTLQIYFDFSGYSDMALGISRVFNVELPINFNSPFKAASIVEFWRRWHMSLSAFLRDYLYVPLGGNRLGGTRRHINIMVTMLLGGLWHGAGATFIVWGAMHGTFIIANHAWRRLVPGGLEEFLPPAVARALGIGMTFLAVVIAFVMFRAASLPAGFTIIKAMFVIDAAAPGGEWPVLALLSGLACVWLLPNSNELLRLFQDTQLKARKKIETAVALFCAVMFARSVASLSNATEFLYFQF
jgi:alginate O-acetyltransferase complex protein AlgI